MGRKLYYTRHGESLWNVENKICGQTDIPLTEHGHHQAEETGRMILERKIPIDEILCSPLSRASETARHISEITGIPVKIEPSLIEQNFGIWEKQTRDTEEFRMAVRTYFDSFGTGESMARLCHMLYTLLDKLKNDSSGKNYLLVAHNGVARAVKSYFCNDLTNEQYSAFSIKNCQILEFDFD